MQTYEFDFILDRAPNDDEQDRLYEVGGDDAMVEYNLTTNTGTVHFDRQAESLAEALVSALRTIEAAGLRTVAVASEDLVTLKEIAARTSRGYESVRLLAAGKRGPGGFPPPLSAEGWSLYSWAQVSDWFRKAYAIEQAPTGDYDRMIAAADHLVRARALLADQKIGQLAELVC